MLKSLLIGVVFSFGCFAESSMNSAYLPEEIKQPKMVAFLVGGQKTPIEEDKESHQAPQIKRDLPPIRNKHRHLPVPPRPPVSPVMQANMIQDFSVNSNSNVSDNQDSYLDLIKDLNTETDNQLRILPETGLFYESKQIEQLTKWSFSKPDSESSNKMYGEF